MKCKIIMLLVLFLLPIFSVYCQNSNLGLEYHYDANGNRKSRRVIYLNQLRQTTSDTSLIAYDYDGKFIKEDLENGNFESLRMSLDNVNINIYPNPVIESLYIEIEENFIGEVNYQIIDFNGRIVGNNRINSSYSLINFSEISSGAYILRLYTNDSSKEYKVVRN